MSEPESADNLAASATIPDATSYKELIDPQYTLPIDEPLPKYSRFTERMGCTPQQWINSYLERRAHYIQEAHTNGRVPKLTDFHIQLAAAMNEVPISYVQGLAKIAAAIRTIAEPGVVRTAGSGLSDTYPVFVTDAGARAISDKIAQTTTSHAASSKQRAELPSQADTLRMPSLEELIGSLVLENKYIIVDPQTRTIVKIDFLRRFARPADPPPQAEQA